ncbi:MAG: hypothetical protein ACFB21_04615, partial [Opitutales bacterium]
MTPGYDDQRYGAHFLASLWSCYRTDHCIPALLDPFLDNLCRKSVRRTLAHWLGRNFRGPFSADILQCSQLPDSVLSPQLLLASSQAPRPLAPIVQQWLRLCRVAGIQVSAKRPLPLNFASWQEAVQRLQAQLMLTGILPSHWDYGPPPPPGFQKVTASAEVDYVTDAHEVCLILYKGDLADGERVAYRNPTNGEVCIVNWSTSNYQLEEHVGRANALVNNQETIWLKRWFTLNRRGKGPRGLT